MELLKRAWEGKCIGAIVYIYTLIAASFSRLEKCSTLVGPQPRLGDKLLGDFEWIVPKTGMQL